MKARITNDRNWIQIYDYAPSELEQLRISLTKKIRGWYFNPLVKKKLWDGNVKFIDKFNRIPIGLIEKVHSVCSKYNIPFEIEDIDLMYWDFDEADFDAWAAEFCASMEKKPRDYQVDAAKRIIKNQRSISEIATSAGKTMIIFLVFSYLRTRGLVDRLLVIVPNTNLILQTIEDFDEYSNNRTLMKFRSQTVSGESKTKTQQNADLIVGTFQSLVKLEEDWFTDITGICVDEAHHTNANSVKKVIGKCVNAKFKFGLSGTLMQDDSADALTIQAFIGPLVNTISPQDLFDKKVATQVNIKIVRLQYSNEEIKQKLHFLRQRKNEVEGSKQLSLERDLIVKSKERFKFVCDLISKTNKNSLVLFQNIKDNYGKRIYDHLRETCDEKEIYYVDGSTAANLREEYKKNMEDGDNRVLIASFGTFSTGISINNLHNIFFVESYKSEKIVKQSIGRGMRLHAQKDKVTIVDIVDDLSWKGDKNYLMKHGDSRIEIYDQEGFPYKIYKVEI
jgi:superfamily II DNA or RNA helicase